MSSQTANKEKMCVRAHWGEKKKGGGYKVQKAIKNPKYADKSCLLRIQTLMCLKDE